jgi:hypothetical protein
MANTLATTHDDEGQRLKRIEHRAARPAPDGAAMDGAAPDGAAPDGAAMGGC